MYFLLICLFLPMINGIAMVKIHRSAVYRPVSSCTFLRNISIPSDGSIQSCIWECVHENDCQTSVYYDDENICSIFTESCQIDRIQSSGNVRTSVICYRTRTEHTNTCSSTATTAQMEEEKTAIPATVTSTEYGTLSTTTAPSTITTIATQIFQQPSFTASSVSSNMWARYSYSYLAPTSAHVTLKFSFLANADFSWRLDDVSVRDQASTELLTNGDFESYTPPLGWVQTSACSPPGFGPYCGLSNSGCHSSNLCYFHSYAFSESVYQSFNVMSGQVYDVTFWLYLKYSNSHLPNLANAQMDVSIS